MDYSLLVGIHYRTEKNTTTTETVITSELSKNNENKKDPDEGFPSRVVVGPGIYKIGIIDILQRWNINKRMEQWAKMIFKCHCHDWEDISAVEPGIYARRFITMLGKVFELDDKTIKQAMETIENDNPARKRKNQFKLKSKSTV